MGRMRLLSAHPLDSPLVALAVRIDDTDPDRPVVAGVAAVRATRDGGLERFQGGTAGLRTFLANDPVIGHGLGVPLALLAETGAVPGGDIWDVQELAGLLIPEAADDPLPVLARRLDAATEDGAGFDEAIVVLEVFRQLLADAMKLPSSVLRRLADLAARSQSTLSDLLAALAEEPRPADEPGAGPVGGFDLRSLAARLERPRSIGAARQPVVPLDIGEIEQMLGPDGPLAAQFPRFESRPEQVEMARAVAAALGARDDGGEPHHLVVEGGTGIGKSVAYLLPAILFAARNNARVVVSTNTINLQEQLVSKDIPALIAALDGAPGVDARRFRYTQLKGKANYLCLRRWEAMANSDLIGPDDARTLAKTLVWLRETRSGDRSELRLHGREAVSFERMSATHFQSCPGAREGACFYRHARERAAAAHLVVVNHALLLSDLRVEGSVLPDFDYLVVDEAHNLEEEATRQFGFRVGQATVEDLAERLGNVAHSLTNSLRLAKGLADERRDDVRTRIEETQQTIPHVRDTWARLSNGLAAFAKEQREGPQGDDGEVRITPGLRAQPAWSDLDIAWDDYERSAADASHRAEALLKAMEELPESSSVPALDQLRGDLAEWLTHQAEVRINVAGFISQPEEQMVYWVGRGAGASLNGAPLEVGTRLETDLFGQKHAVVLTSATLAVRDGFGHVKQRLGVPECEELRLGSPFDYRKAALLALPTDVPEPGSPQYADAVATVVADLARGADGRTMALFTSHAAIRATAARLRRLLAGSGIGVLAQAIDGTPPQLLERFQADSANVLLGTASFWEGVDVGNETLKVLVLARLPFNVPTEPIFAARSGLYEQPFMQYAVPQAVLRFRQGFGRLIRGKEDHGAVVVLDSRLTSKPYGRSFLASVPEATTLRAPLGRVVGAVRDWLEGRLTPDEVEAAE